MPALSASFLAALLSAAESNGAAATLPAGPSGRLEPLCAVYQRVPCLMAAEESIALGEHTPRAMLDKVATRYVQFDEFANLRGSEHFFINLNRPEDYERARKLK